MALKSTPEGLQRAKIPILKGIDMDFLWLEKVDPSKIKAEGSRARGRDVIRNLTFELQNVISQKTSL